MKVGRRELFALVIFFGSAPTQNRSNYRQNEFQAQAYLALNGTESTECGRKNYQ
jgi:hypothetical protein